MLLWVPTPCWAALAQGREEAAGTPDSEHPWGTARWSAPSTGTSAPWSAGMGAPGSGMGAPFSAGPDSAEPKPALVSSAPLVLWHPGYPCPTAPWGQRECQPPKQPQAQPEQALGPKGWPNSPWDPDPPCAPRPGASWAPTPPQGLWPHVWDTQQVCTPQVSRAHHTRRTRHTHACPRPERARTHLGRPEHRVSAPAAPAEPCERTPGTCKHTH